MLKIQKFDKIITANWKMNGSIKFINNFIKKLTFENNSNSSLCSIICPPFTYSNYLLNNLKNYYLGGQDCSLYEEGAYTGVVSASMLRDIGCQFCIIGHSERRINFKETNQEVSIKATNSLKNNIHPIICIGETL